MPVTTDQLLPVVRVGEIKSQENAQRWLVEGLWGASSVGVIGGAPKCAKTWLGLDMALSVATGTPCLGKYAVPQPGPVLVYLAEDALLVVRERVAGMARHRGLDLAGVDIHVITAPTLRLDRGRGSDPAPGDNQAAAAPPAPAGSPGETSRHRREQRGRSGRVAGVLSLVTAAARPVGPAGASHAEERRGGSRRWPGPARLRRYSRLRRLEPLSPANQGTPDPLQRAPRRARVAHRSIWIWSRPTRRRPTWRSSRSCGKRSDAVSRSKSSTFCPRARC